MAAAKAAASEARADEVYVTAPPAKRAAAGAAGVFSATGSAGLFNSRKISVTEHRGLWPLAGRVIVRGFLVAVGGAFFFIFLFFF